MAPSSRNKTKQSNERPGSRKRTRREIDHEKLQQYGIDLPDINGLPVTLIPLHVQAIKSTLASIKHDHTHAALIPKNNHHGGDDMQNHNLRLLEQAARSSRQHQSASSSSSLLENLLDRVQQATDETDQQQDTEAQQAKEERTNKRNDAVQTWLQALRREIQKDDRIPVATMTHFWESAVDHKRISARRTVLFLAGSLLQKSAVARQWLLETHYEESFAKWLDAVVVLQEQTNNATNNSRAFRLWQREAYRWITQLLDEGHGGLYPRLVVARQRLDQECPGIAEDPDVHEAFVHLQNMTTWRSWRDMAMQHAEEEQTRVHRLLEACHGCVDVLVPSVVTRNNTTTPAGRNHDIHPNDLGASTTEQAKDDPNTHQDQSNIRNTDENDGSNDDSDDEEDISWEDGEDENDYLDPAQHQDAVERTLQAMQSTRVMEEGAIQIDWNIPRTDTEQGRRTREETEEVKQAKLRLNKCIHFLSNRHLPRLAHWVDGLTKADSLKTIPETGAMMELDDGEKQHRKDVSDKLMALKTRISSTISMAKRLGVDLKESLGRPSGALPHVTRTAAPATVQVSRESHRVAPRRVVIRYSNRETRN